MRMSDLARADVRVLLWTSSRVRYWPELYEVDERIGSAKISGAFDRIDQLQRVSPSSLVGHAD
jgi:hypothetical protein